MRDVRGLFWATVWLALVLIGVKAYFLGPPAGRTLADGRDYLSSLAAISYADVLFAAVVGACGRAIFWLARGRRTAVRGVVAVAALSSSYALANVVLFGVFGGFVTYSLVAFTGHVRLLSSSVAALLTPRVALALVALPFIHIALVHATLRLVSPGRGRRWLRHSVAFAVIAVWVLVGQQVYATTWATRQEHRIAENPHWVLLSSSWGAIRYGIVRLDGEVVAADLADFEPIGARQRIGPAPPRPTNVILIVLESVAARWTSVNGGAYDTTPNLKAESARAASFDNVYAHVGRSSDSLPAMLLSLYSKLDFRDLTEEYPRLPGTSLAAVFERRGYRTAFITPTDLTWGGWSTFLEGRGFDDVRDYHRLPCTPPLSSWGVEDRCMVDAMIEFIDREPARPFFLMGWTEQTHYPYETTPGVPPFDLVREPVQDDYDLGRYLNVLHETDRHLGRLFGAIRRAGLDENTLVVITGDHGQAFGYPHDSYAQGVTAYEEDVHVPLLFWSPRLYRSAVRPNTIGSHVDLAPTIADLVGLPPAPEWQGRSLFDVQHPPRAYFFVAEDRFVLGVREGNWKYMLDLRAGVDELYDLDRDPTEQHNLATAQPERSARLRQRLVAWMEANRRQYVFQ